MTTQAPENARSFQPPTKTPVAGGVLVGAGGVDVANTIRVAAAMAKRLRRQFSLVSVVEPFQAGVWDLDALPWGTLELERASVVRAELARTIHPHDEEMDWPVEVVSGDIPRVLADITGARRTALLVVGIGRRRPVDRLLGAETALKTVREVSCPVLAVNSQMTELPVVAVVGVDFSAASAVAARWAAQLLVSAGTLHLVHVWQPSDRDDEAWRMDDDVYRRQLPERFRRFIATLSLPPTMRVTQQVREGRASERLTDFAEAHRADLIAVGRSRHTLLHRLFVGSVAERVLRASACSVLIVPAPPADDESSPRESSETIEPRAWAARLDDFTRSNAGKLVSLRDIDGATGASSTESGYVLFGTLLAANDDVHIVLGETNGRRNHLTRALSHVSAITTGHDADGRELWLAVDHGGRRTLLTVYVSQQARWESAPTVH